MEMTSYLMSSKVPFTDEDGHSTKALQKEKHDTASHCYKTLQTETGVVVD